MSQGTHVENPYNLRWLAPFICRNDLAWIITTSTSIIATCTLAAIYANAWPAALLALGLSGVVLFNAHHPILVDTPAMALALAATITNQHHQIVATILLALLAGATKETAPVFAALWAWSPLPLIGLAAPTIRAIFWRPGPDLIGDEASDARQHLKPLIIKTRLMQAPQFGTEWVLGWGVTLIALSAFDLQMGLVLLVAYAQLAIATDTMRLTAWAFPPLVAATCANVNPKWWVPMIVVHLANPWKGSGL